MPVTYRKTAVGQNEIETRAGRIPPRLRSALILVDGKRSDGDLRKLVVQPDETLKALLDAGMIEVATPAAAPRAAEVDVSRAESVPQRESMPPALEGMSEGERFMKAQKIINDAAVEVLGLRAFLFTLKIEKCFTAADLMALMPEVTDAVTKKRGEAAARTLASRVQHYLG